MVSLTSGARIVEFPLTDRTAFDLFPVPGSLAMPAAPFSRFAMEKTLSAFPEALLARCASARAPKVMSALHLLVFAMVALLPRPGGADAAVIFQDTADAITGGTKGLGALTSIPSNSPFSTGNSGSYLESSIPAGSASATIVTYTPSTASSSWSALVGPPINAGGVNYVCLNGAFELFVRPNQTEAGTNWFRPVDITAISDSAGMRLIVNSTQVQILTASGTNALGNAPGSFTTDNSFSLTSPINTYANYLLTGAIVHLGVTFNTNAQTGQITVKVFGAPNIGALNTSSSTVGQGNLLAVQTLYANADLNKR